MHMPQVYDIYRQGNDLQRFLRTIMCLYVSLSQYFQYFPTKKVQYSLEKFD